MKSNSARANAGPLHRLADGRGVGRVVLAALAAHAVRRHQRGHQRVQLGARDARAPQVTVSRLVHTVQCKHVLCQIDADSDNSHGLPLPSGVDEGSHFPSWHFDAGRRFAASSGRGSPFHSLGTRVNLPVRLHHNYSVVTLAA